MILDTYFRGYKEFRDDFKKRTIVLEYLHFLQDERFISERFKVVDGGREKEDNVALSWRSWALYVQNQIVKKDCRQKLYLSRHGGDVQPLFFLNMMFADERLKRAMDYV